MTRWQALIDRALPPLTHETVAVGAPETMTNSSAFRLKFLAAFIGLVVLPMAGISLYLLERYEDTVRANTFQRLGNIADKKSQQIDTFITERMDNVQEQAIDPDLLDVIAKLSAAWHQHGPKSEHYQQLAASLQPLLAAHLQEKYYYDLLIMDADGNILATYLHESDQFTNLLTGPWKNTNLAQGFRLSRDYLYSHATSIQRYAPSDNKLAIFFIAPIIRDGEFMGAVAMQSNRSTQIPVFTDTTGLGMGETVITTLLNHKIIFMTPLSRNPDNTFRYTENAASTTNQLIAKSLSGDHGSGQAQDYSNTSVLASWRYLPDFHAGLIVKIDTAEALSAVIALRRQLYFIILMTLIPLSLLAWWLCRTLLRTLSNYQKNNTVMYTEKINTEIAASKKTMFLEKMIHEIRIPTNTIIGMSNLTLKTELSPKQNNYINKTNQAATSLLGIINDIVDFTKIETGNLLIDNIAIDLEKILLNVSAINRDRAFGKGLELIIQPEKNLPYQLFGDPHRLEQILNNLINNAIKFTEYGEIIIKITLLEKTDSRLKLDFQVIDSGIGLTLEQQQTLFDPLKQADITCSRKHGGSGLGLSISKQLIELMSGEINVSSQIGIGSCFDFTAWFDYINIHTPSMVLPVVMNNMRVLIVDDIESSRLVLKTILSPQLFKIDMCNSGAAAIQMALQAQKEQSPFDIILMDWQMPDMDGISAAAEIHKKLPSENKPYIVLVTAFNNADVNKEFNSHLLDGILMKPVTSSTLIDCMVELFNPNISEANIKNTRARIEERPELIGMQVLLVEDNTINQQIANELMTSSGIEVTIANNGQEALDILKRNETDSFDTILMDIQMPVMDGYEACRRIRLDHRYDHIPLVAMTAHAMIEEKEHCLAIGMNDHISKPINPVALLDRLQYWRLQNNSLQAAQKALSPQKNHDYPALTDTENEIFLRLAELPGFCLTDGLNYVGNDKKLYLKLLKQACNGESDYAERIKTALDNGDLVSSMFHAHTLKGIAATFGATALVELADQTEKTLVQAEKTIDIHPLMQSIKQNLAMLSQALNSKPTDTNI